MTGRDTGKREASSFHRRAAPLAKGNSLLRSGARGVFFVIPRNDSCIRQAEESNMSL
jgi:hypothetical protein